MGNGNVDIGAIANTAATLLSASSGLFGRIGQGKQALAAAEVRKAEIAAEQAKKTRMVIIGVSIFAFVVIIVVVFLLQKKQ